MFAPTKEDLMVSKKTAGPGLRRLLLLVGIYYFTDNVVSETVCAHRKVL